MPFKEGHDKIGGRGKGDKNKHTKAFKDLLIETYQALESDKDEKLGLLAFAKSSPNDFYRICNKLIPQEIAGDIKGDITIRVVRD